MGWTKFRYRTRIIIMREQGGECWSRSPRARSKDRAGPLEHALIGGVQPIWLVGPRRPRYIERERDQGTEYTRFTAATTLSQITTDLGLREADGKHHHVAPHHRRRTSASSTPTTSPPLEQWCTRAPPRPLHPPPMVCAPLFPSLCLSIYLLY